MHNAITDVGGIKVGHYTDSTHATGCTVLLCANGCIAGVDVRGSAPGTRETDLLRPGNLIQQVHAVLLSGGGAFGLDAASGVMRYLEERGAGFKLGASIVPIVPAAILFDLGLVSGQVRPDALAGYKASQSAKAGAVQEGSVGAGTGATIGKALGLTHAVKGGIGTASMRVGKKTVVGAIAAVNAYGDVVNPGDGQTMAGPRKLRGNGFHDTRQLLLQGKVTRAATPTNTTLVVVACSARLTKEEITKIAQQAQNGIALTIRPAHTMGDGDIVFGLATSQNDERLPLNQLGAAATEVTSQAIMSAVHAAQSLGGIPSARDYLASREARRPTQRKQP